MQTWNALRAFWRDVIGATDEWIAAQINKLWILLVALAVTTYVMGLALPDVSCHWFGWHGWVAIRLLLLIPMAYFLHLPVRVNRWRPIEVGAATAGTKMGKKAQKELWGWAGVGGGICLYLIFAPTFGHVLCTLGTVMPFGVLVYMGKENKEDNRLWKTTRILLFSGLFIGSQVYVWGDYLAHKAQDALDAHHKAKRAEAAELAAATTAARAPVSPWYFVDDANNLETPISAGSTITPGASLDVSYPGSDGKALCRIVGNEASGYDRWAEVGSARSPKTHYTNAVWTGNEWRGEITVGGVSHVSRVKRD